jgi:hypothetical protein
MGDKVLIAVLEKDSEVKILVAKTAREAGSPLIMKAKINNRYPSVITNVAKSLSIKTTDCKLVEYGRYDGHDWYALVDAVDLASFRIIKD